MISPGVHINAVGGDCPGKTELHAEILQRPDARIVVEYEPQSRIEGEVQQFGATFPVIEFCDVVSGAERARRSDYEVTIFDSVGFALEDFSALRYLERLHRESPGAQSELDLIPASGDPRDLFGELSPTPLERARAV
jgi:ornithine cyclodeaminase